jgi:hypothetical protein
MAKSIFVAAAVSLALSGIAHCGELDGKVLICDLVGMNYNKTMFSFEGDQVVETHLLYKNMHDDNYNFDYESITSETKSNFLSISESKLFWCNVSNVMEMGSPGSACQAQNLDELVSKAFAKDLTAGSWTIIDRTSLEVSIGVVIMTNFVDAGSGTCILSDDDGKKKYLNEQDAILKASKSDYDKKLEDAKVALEKKKI